VTRLDPDQPIYDVFPMEALVNRSLKTRRFVLWLMNVSAASGAALAALGLYGLIAYRVATQKRELGIRKAIGATNQAVAWTVCRGGLALVSAGIAAGFASAFVAHRYIESELYGVRLTDAAVWLAATAILAFAGALACAIPAWRAARTSPMEALRSE
jgi:ABC-type antimicrobial peptide transport system permease subunit